MHMNRFAESSVDFIGAMPRIRAVLAALLVIASATHAAAARPTCVLPVPDGGDASPSRANVEGRIVRVGQDFIDVARRPGQPIRITYTGKTEFYSAFGGDYEPSELAVGQHVAVWFVGCKPSRDGAGQAAYLQLYSKDPADQPPG